ncbi:MAG: hypothetical protein LBP35_03440 [Candidatus Ancillula trichonymphae]|nr:hypothetical protein [Candidatus Ancillula trichonymphae]
MMPIFSAKWKLTATLNDMDASTPRHAVTAPPPQSPADALPHAAASSSEAFVVH